MDKNDLSLLSKLPKNWVSTLIGDICNINPTLTWPENFTDDTEVSFVPMSAVDETKGIIAKPEVRPVSEVWRGYTRFREGDVIFAKITPSMENGKAAIATNLINGIGLGTTEFHVLSPTDPWVAKWIYYYIRRDVFRENASRAMTGTAGQLRVPTDYLVESAIPLAPYNEIKRIVDEIEAQFSRLDAWLEIMQKLRAKLPRLRASILKAAVEGRLVEQNPDDEPASVLLQRILDERRRKWEEDYLADLKAKGKPVPKNDTWKEKYLEPEKPDVDGLPDLPEGWTWATIEQVGEVRLGRQRSPEKQSRYYPTKYIRAANITERGLALSDILEMEFTPEEQEIYRLQRGDIVIAEASGSLDQVGKSAIWNNEIETCCFQNTIIRLRASQVDSRYLLIVLRHFYQSGVMARIASGVGINHLSAGRFVRLTLPLAPKKQQCKITNDIDMFFSVISCLDNIVEANIKRIRKMRQSILKKAFKGELVEQDPNDEPASTLLKRIHEERQHRADEERQKPRPQRGRKVTTEVVRRSLYETLQEAGQPLPVRDLFQQAGFSQETIDDFYEEVRRAIYIDKVIRCKHGANNEVFLEVID
jgi:type I restriction enzyme S subunit